LATEQALVFLDRLFSTGPEALGAAMAGQAEEGIGDPTVVSASASFLAADVVNAVGHRPDEASRRSTQINGATANTKMRVRCADLCRDGTQG
jgi:hypothetical protein